jgi:hypothetical protein
MFDGYRKEGALWYPSHRRIIVGRTDFDWRWIVVIVIALMFFGQLSLSPSPILGVVLLGLGGYWALRAGMTPWRGRGSLLGNTKVTYWRGQRIEMKQPARSRWATPATTPLLVSVLYLALGVVFWIGAVMLLFRIVT